MKTLSNEAKQLLKEFKSQVEFRNIKALRESLLDIEARGEPLIAIRLLPYLTSADVELVKLVDSAIGNLMSGIYPHELLQLGQFIRGSQWYIPDWKKGFREFEPEHVSILYKRLGLMNSIALLTMHRNGFVREQALNIIVSKNSGIELPFLLVMTTDWVEVIRSKAISAVIERLNSKHAKQIADCLKLLEILGLRDRFDKSLSKRVTQVFSEIENREFVFRCLSKEDTQNRRACTRFLQRTESPLSNESIDRFLCCDDNIIRLIGFKMAIESFSETMLNPLIDEMIYDKSISIRREAFRAGIENQQLRKIELLKEALMDRSKSIRHFAQFYLKQVDKDFDYRGFYTRKLDSECSISSLAILISGIGEVGDTNDAQNLEKFLDSQSFKIRKAAIESIAVLNIEQFKEVIFEQILSESVGVSKTAVKYIISEARSFEPDHLSRLICEVRGKPKHIGINLLKVVEQLNYWRKLIVFIEAALLESTFKIECCTFVEQWCYKYIGTWKYNRPSTKEIDCLQAAIPRVIELDLNSTAKKVLSTISAEYKTT